MKNDKQRQLTNVLNEIKEYAERKDGEGLGKALFLFLAVHEILDGIDGHPDLVDYMNRVNNRGLDLEGEEYETYLEYASWSGRVSLFWLDTWKYSALYDMPRLFTESVTRSDTWALEYWKTNKEENLANVGADILQRSALTRMLDCCEGEKASRALFVHCGRFVEGFAYQLAIRAYFRALNQVLETDAFNCLLPDVKKIRKNINAVVNPLVTVEKALLAEISPRLTREELKRCKAEIYRLSRIKTHLKEQADKEESEGVEIALPLVLECRTTENGTHFPSSIKQLMNRFYPYGNK